ncbi:MAG: prepilin-type N-terminal cleavage/methylation domain-containing protein, partial [Chthoniobacterales bacterium]
MHTRQVKSASVRPSPALRQRAFTLVELLVTIGIIAILAALVIAALPGFVQRGKMAESLNNLRQIGVGFQLYANDHDFSLPGRVTDGRKWPSLIVEYLGNDPKVYADPADKNNYVAQNSDPLSDETNNTSYIMNGYNDVGAYDDPSVTIKANVVDQPSQTILAAAQSHSGNFYMDFVENNEDKVLNKRLYGDGSTYLFVDGSSRFIKEDDYDNYLWL